MNKPPITVRAEDIRFYNDIVDSRFQPETQIWNLESTTLYRAGAKPFCKLMMMDI